MSGPAEVGVIYGHGIPGIYINAKLASYEDLARWKQMERKILRQYISRRNGQKTAIKIIISTISLTEFMMGEQLKAKICCILQNTVLK